ncbi:MAG: tRNA (cytidine(34)-2'-O)-methyltransferase [Elsteraceae bacterium]
MRLVLFQPDIPQNVGTLLRLAACWALPVDVIEPCGFLWDDRRLRRAGMDYLADVDLRRHSSWEAYAASDPAGRLLLLTTKASDSHARFAYLPSDRLMVGRESSGVPDAVHAVADARLRIPMAPGQRSLNVALAAGVVLGEALRQTGGFPE